MVNTDTDIANMALDLLKENPILSLDADVATARWMKRNFATSRDALLRIATWNFALKRTSLPKDADTPAFGWDYAYTLPADYLRLPWLTADGEYEGRPVPHEVENRKILTDATAPLKVRYIYRNEQYDTYPADFVEALAAKLALKMAHFVTGKSSYAEIAQRAYKQAIEQAFLLDAIEGIPERAVDDEWIRARG